MNVSLLFVDGAEIEADQNGTCFITDTKPNFPDDLSVVTVSGLSGEYILHNAELIECASVDGRYWFAFRELSTDELRQIEYDNTIQVLTDCLLEMSETVYA